MPQAGVRVAFGPTGATRGPQLVVDSADADRLEPAHYAPARLGFALYNEGYNELPLTLLRYGRATLRLYGPDIPTAVVALDELVTAEPQDDSFFIGSVFVRFKRPALTGDQVQRIGRKIATITEALTFDGDTEQQIRYPHDDPPITIVTASSFVDELGTEVDTPVAQPGGFLVAQRPVFGGFIVTYQATYTEYEVYYELARPVFPFLVADNGFSMQFLPIPTAPPLRVFARNEEGVSLVNVERDVYEWDFSGLAGTDFDGTEIEVENETVRVENPNDAQQFVDVKRVKKVRFRDSAGRTISLTRTLP